MLKHAPRRGLLFSGSDWNFRTLSQAYDVIETVAKEELGLDTYPVQMEVISSEQMLDAYSSIGMPVLYNHWSFGKRFARDEKLYRKGYTGLAYEIVINSDPCISYMMEENTMTMQALVMAHAAFGHNHFFKNNYLFREWTDAEGILDYLNFARTYVARCEEKHGIAAVERILDAAHALMDHGVNRYGRRPRPSLVEEEKRAEARRRHQRETYNDLWRTVPKAKREGAKAAAAEADAGRLRLGLPEENLLYFIEKFSPRLKDWERELVRIVRNIAQYFYPQKQTKMMNEGCATFVHYRIMNRLYDLGKISEGAMLEFIASHANVLTQPDFDDPRYSGINPYALGFEMMRDIERIVTDPTDEDRACMPQVAGNGDDMGTLKTARAQFRYDAFVAQYLSPYVLLPISPLQGRNDLVKPAETLRSVAVSIPSSNDGKVDVQVELKTAQAGQDLRTLLADRFSGEPIEVTGEGERCRLQTPFDPARISSMVSRLIQEEK